MLIECPACKHKVSKEYCFVCPNCNHRIKEPTPTQEEHANLRLEYQEINHWARHIEIAWWAVGGLLLPLTFGVFYKGIGSMQILAPGGFLIVVFWWLYMIFTKYIQLKELQIVDRAKKIEEKLGMEYYKKELDETEKDKMYNDFIDKGINILFNRRLFKKMSLNFRFYDFMYTVCFTISIVWIIIITFQSVGWIPSTVSYKYIEVEQSLQEMGKEKKVMNNQKNGKVNILKDITPSSFNCGIAVCPAIFETDQRTYIIIGSVVDSKTVKELLPGRVGKGEIAIEIPQELLPFDVRNNSLQKHKK